MRMRSMVLTLSLAAVPMPGIAAPHAVDSQGGSTCQLFDVRVGHRAGPYRVGDLYPFSLTIRAGGRSASRPGPRALEDPEPGEVRFLIDGKEIGRTSAGLMPERDLLGAGFFARIPSPGKHVFTAEYLGTDLYAPCEAQDSTSIAKAFSLVDLWAVPQGEKSDKVTVRLRSPYRSPKGRVTLWRGKRAVGTRALSIWSTATFTVSRQTRGSTPLRVTFPGDPQHESLDYRVALPVRSLRNKSMTFAATADDVYWTRQAVATVQVDGRLPRRSSLAVVESGAREPGETTPVKLICQRARWCHVTLDPRRGLHWFQGQQLRDPGAVLRRTHSRSVYWWW